MEAFLKFRISIPPQRAEYVGISSACSERQRVSMLRERSALACIDKGLPALFFNDIRGAQL